MFTEFGKITNFSLTKGNWMKKQVQSIPPNPFIISTSNSEERPLNFILLYLHSRTHFLILERGEQMERLKERNINVREKHRLVASHMHPDWGWTRRLDMCADPESNPRSFSAGDDSPTSWATPARADPSILTISVHWQQPYSINPYLPLVVSAFPGHFSTICHSLKP